MDMETALAKVSMDITSRRDPNKVYHLMPVSELSTLAPSLAWNRFLLASGAPPINELNVANPDFIKGMNSLIDVHRSGVDQDLLALAGDHFHSQLRTAQAPR